MRLVTRVTVLICMCIIFNNQLLACPQGCRCGHWQGLRCWNLTSFLQLQTIPTNATTLSLWYNKIRNITLSEEDLTNHSQVVHLYLHNNHLTLLPTFNVSVLSAFTGLRTLYLSNNRIQDIEDHAFMGLHQLQELYLYENRIQNITDQTFRGLHQLQTLYLYKNRIQNITDLTFSGLHQLQDLDLSDNRIQNITDQAFRGLHQLQKLDLSINRIKDIRNGTFRDLGNLQTLGISFNRITNVVSSWFYNLTFLTELHLDNNMISSFEPYYFSWPDSLLKLYLQNNRITAFPPLSIKNCSTNTSCQNTKLYVLGNDIYCGCRRPEHDQTVLNMTLPLVYVCCVDVDQLCLSVPNYWNYKRYRYPGPYDPFYNFKFNIHSYIQQPVCDKPRIDINDRDKSNVCTAKGEPKPELTVTFESIRSSDSQGTKILKTTCTASNAIGTVTKTFYSMPVCSLNIPLWAMVTLCLMSFTTLIIVIAFVIASFFDNNKFEFNNEENNSDILPNSDNVSDIYDSVI